MRTTWSFHVPHQLVFGRNAVQQLGEIAQRLKADRLLLVTDPILCKAGLADRVKQAVEAQGVGVKIFDGGEPEPSIGAAEACIDTAERFQAKGLLGLGGGSNMDLAKITATVLAHDGAPRDYFGEDKIPGPVWPLICVPTTAGTGSEVSAASVLTDTANKMKVGVLSNYLRPTAAVVDPLLTVSCPPKVTADSGIDALTHAIEAYTAVDNETFPLPEGERSVYQGRHPMGDLLAEKAISLVGQFLRRAVRDGNDLEARDGMALGATLAGMAFSNVGVALVHAMEYPVGGAVHVSHGAGNGLLLPWVMRFNLSARVPQFGAIARLLGVDVSRMKPEEAAQQAIAEVERLSADIGIPRKLRDIGVQKEQLPQFAEKACSIRRILRVNPRPVTTAEVQQVYETAF
ncbi:MAG: iron-containing alcohol dehydrogenase [Planctomycetia bacterium]|nr:iron-containing alcohol dehydrogenase [Planctomycetia bacterium]